MSLTDKLSLDWDENHNYLPEQREIVEKCILEWEWMLPYWIRRIHLVYSTNADPLSVEISYKYRQLIINIGDSFFTSSKQFQSEYILHEMCHGHTTRQLDVARRMAKEVMLDDVYKLYESEIIDSIEHATESLAEIFWKIGAERNYERNRNQNQNRFDP